LDGCDWVKAFISELLTISHTHWLVCNITLDDKRQGFLAVTRKKELISQIEQLHNTPIDEIPAEINILLNCVLVELKAVDTMIIKNTESMLFLLLEEALDCASGASTRELSQHCFVFFTRYPQMWKTPEDF
jgi:hypothetical protein